jgi:hypothetical protein
MRFNKENVSEFISELEKRSYKRYSGSLKNEDYGYWKSFGIKKDEFGDATFNYQIAFLFYDFSKYPSYVGEPIGVQCDFVMNGTDEISRLDLSLSEDKMTVDVFEELCKDFYENLCVKFLNKLKK